MGLVGEVNHGLGVGQVHVVAWASAWFAPGGDCGVESAMVIHMGMCWGNEEERKDVRG